LSTETDDAVEIWKQWTVEQLCKRLIGDGNVDPLVKVLLPSGALSIEETMPRWQPHDAAGKDANSGNDYHLPHSGFLFAERSTS
jgi:hypothetical protein